MAINYSRLFLLMKEKKVLQKDIIDSCKISANTFARMKKGFPITLETLDKICEHLDCDFGDVISRENKNTLLENSNVEFETKAVRYAIVEYMKVYSLSKAKFCKKCGLSYNTLSSLLNGYIPSKNTVVKLISLGNDFTYILTKHLNGNPVNSYISFLTNSLLSDIN